MSNRLHGRKASEVAGMRIAKMPPRDPIRKHYQHPLPHKYKEVHAVQVTIIKTSSALLMTLCCWNILQSSCCDCCASKLVFYMCSMHAATNQQTAHAVVMCRPAKLHRSCHDMIGMQSTVTETGQ